MLFATAALAAMDVISCGTDLSMASAAVVYTYDINSMEQGSVSCSNAMPPVATITATMGTAVTCSAADCTWDDTAGTTGTTAAVTLTIASPNADSAGFNDGSADCAANADNTMNTVCMYTGTTAVNTYTLITNTLPLQPEQPTDPVQPMTVGAVGTVEKSADCTASCSPDNADFSCGSATTTELETAGFTSIQSCIQSCNGCSRGRGIRQTTSALVTTVVGNFVDQAAAVAAINAACSGAASCSGTVVEVDPTGAPTGTAVPFEISPSSTSPFIPTAPSQPVQPAEPTEPTEPAQPAEPTEPAQPYQPAEPSSTTQISQTTCTEDCATKAASINALNSNYNTACTTGCTRGRKLRQVVNGGTLTTATCANVAGACDSQEGCDTFFCAIVNAGFTLDSCFCAVTAVTACPDCDESKKGLLGLLGLLGLIPLLLLLVLLICCCLRRKKRMQDVQFATFDPAPAPAVACDLPPPGPPVGSCVPPPGPPCY